MGGVTADELEVKLKLSHQTCSARVTELLKDKAIHWKGKRKTRSGRMARVYFPGIEKEQSELW